MTTTKQELEELKAEIEAQRVQLQKLYDQLNPKPFVPMVMPRFDPTEGMSMPRSAMQAMAAVDTSGLQEDLRAFQQKQRSVTSPEPQRPRGSGWRDEVPLDVPGGQSTIAACDRLMDAQDKIDRAELAERLARTAAIEAAAKKQNDDDAA